MARSIEYLIAELRSRDDALCQEAADALVKWKGVADTRLEAAQINHAAYLNLYAETQTKE